MRTREIEKNGYVLTYRVPKAREVFKILLGSGLDVSKLDKPKYMAKHNNTLIEYMLDQADAFVVTMTKDSKEIDWDDFSYEPESIDFIMDLVTAILASLGGANEAEKK
jgi:hypothetical protein